MEPERGDSSPSSDERADEQSDLDLSCSSSSFENDSSTSDVVEEPASGTVEPYQYEPDASDASSGSDGEDVDSDGNDEERSRLSNTDWLVVINTPRSPTRSIIILIMMLLIH